ncbi:hypothetical protein FRC17_009780 [Serendipita sp. 399]|nr:hypothetical protein FRC17_009780 [Serendipita sp. 399]
MSEIDTAKQPPRDEVDPEAKAASHSPLSDHFDEKQRPIHDHEDEKPKFEESYDPNVRDPFPIDESMPEETHQLTLRALVVGALLGCVVGASNIYLGLKTGFTFGPQLFGAIFGFSALKAISKAVPGEGWLAKIGIGGYFGPKENVTVQRLVFPTPTATAFTIRSLHSGPHGEVIAKLKAKALAISLAVCFCWKTLNGYIPGIFLDWHIGWTLYRLGWTEAIKLENFGWIIEFTPAFFGAGMLSGLNASWSFFGGSVLAWGIIAPSIVKTGQAVGVPIDEVNAPGYISYYSMSFRPLPDGSRPPSSPRYWLLWPGVLMMLVFSFVEIGMSIRHVVWANIKNSGNLWPAFKRLFIKDPNYIPEEDIDPAPLEDRVKTWWWVSGAILSIIVSCALMSTQFSMGVGETILALILGYIFSFIGVQSAGDTDINPVSSCAKASQIVFGGVSKGQGMAQEPAQLINLAAGAIAAGAAAQATDMTGDLKTGHLLRAKPKNQFIAQLFGTTIAIFLSAGLFVLFSTASPCILTGDAGCAYSAPSISAWAAVAYAVTAPSLPVPTSSGATALGLSIFAGLTVVAKHLWLPRKYWVWFPNWNAVGLAFVVPQLQYSIAMAFGSTFAWFWLRKSPKTYDMYGFAVSAGMLAGEGLGGVFQALLNVAGVMGPKYGIAVGCPLNEFCG